MNRMKRIPLFIIAAILVGIKTYVVYRFYFDLSIESLFQEIILLVNAFAISMFLFFIAVWLKPKSQKRYILTTGIVL
ncbi:phosphoglycerol transferase MdoB-like AlkP superfamily enzyme [Alkalibacillus filiformis]|uniref:Phosphoglycerol transferase MdoB-like AlkP superfamily enzyme n=1 Tax=Alkalibacillus filiformis TaxID=200990 RepID=A0ABU0DRM2_9BACI|nr:hypothetical protein [Alkalibacillus filiformis]MDQ0351020.1 phosphoglycerol transferase MdoB-like AlkP superfamily enzyme [Alkalibacillus filiformis]